MSTVVQSTCPGCKQPLRIPSDWLTQAIRCKQCGLVLQARSAAAAYAPRPTGVRAGVSSRTPPPPSRSVPLPAPKAIPAAPLAVTANPQLSPPPMAVPLPSGAAPLAVVPAPGPASPFDMLDAEASGPVRVSRYRRGGGWWKGPAVALSVIVVAGVVAFFYRDKIKEALQEPQQASAQVDNKDREPSNAGGSDKPKSDDPPNKPDDPRGKPSDPPNKPNDPGGKPNKPNDPVGKPNIPPNKPNDPATPPKPPDPPKPPPDNNKQAFPRRALIVSVHNYIYANPVGAGPTGPSARNLTTFQEALNKGLHIPMNEIAQLSDAAKMQPRTPLKPVIQTTITNFLDSSRDQDCILVFFIGHSVVIGDETYLVPIEGELDNADTLIPLKWVYEKMAACKARQKVLVMDVNRLNPGRGLERSNGGPMDPKADAALNAPPDGVEVWTACLAGQQSYELDDAPEGAFIDRLYTALSPNTKAGEAGLEGVIQTPKDVMPMKPLADVVNKLLKEEVAPYKLEQQSRLAGSEPKDVAYDPEKAKVPAPNAVESLAAAPPAADMKEIQSVLDEIGMPPIKASNEDSSLRPESLPPFAADKMATYAPSGEMTELRTAVLHAREAIWALNPASPPPALKDDVLKIQKELAVNLSVLKDGYKKAADDNAFKKMLDLDKRKVADMMQKCDDALNELKAVADKRDMETKRWQANYDFTLARLEAQYAYLFEYDSALGQMSKSSVPELAPGQNGWKLAANESLKGDSAGKKLAKDSGKLLDKIAKDNPGTPWEIFAKRLKLTALGLQWQGGRID